MHSRPVQRPLEKHGHLEWLVALTARYMVLSKAMTLSAQLDPTILCTCVEDWSSKSKKNMLHACRARLRPVLSGNSRSRAHPILRVLTESAESIHAILFLHFGEKIVKRTVQRT